MFSKAGERVMYRPSEVAAMCGVCRAHIYNLIKSGELTVVRFGRAVRIPAEALEKLAAGTKHEDAPVA